MSPTITNVKKHAGIAGQFEVSATVTYEGEEPSVARFVGDVYGGPVVMIMPSGVQTFVTDQGRFGKFGTEWVKRFFA